jgi:serine/threonine protein kinase
MAAPAAVPEDEAGRAWSQRLSPGTRVRGRFEIKDVIGRGGLSTVYRALDLIRLRARAADPEVALKIVDIDVRYRSDAVTLLHREGRRLQELQHPNIVRAYDFDEDGPHHFIVMELLRGRTLARILEQRRGAPMPLAQALPILRGAAAGLAAAHARGIVHGDLKPGNIFITAEGGVKLIDFGTAQTAARLSPPADEDATRRFLTRLGAITPAYASLEVLAGEPADPRDDIFSFAVTTYLALSGAHPFGRKPADQAVVEGLVPERPAALGKAQWRVLREGLSLERGERCEDIERLIARLERPGWRDRLPLFGPRPRSEARPEAAPSHADPEPSELGRREAVNRAA